MSWPSDHPAVADPELRPWAGGLDEVTPGAQVKTVLRYLPGRRVTTLVEHEGELVVVKVFASPRARGNARRLRAFAASRAADLVPTVLGCDAPGHVLAITYRHGRPLVSLSDAEYAAAFCAVGATLRELHDSGAELDRVWDWEQEVAELHRRAVPVTVDVVEALVASTGWLSGALRTPAHRDCHPRQVVLAADDTVAFIDLDDAAMSPRGLDVGNVLGHLVRDRLVDARRVRTTEAASEAFLDGYGGGNDLDEAAVIGWTLLALARLAALAQSRHGDAAQRDALLAFCAGHLVGRPRAR